MNPWIVRFIGRRLITVVKAMVFRKAFQVAKKAVSKKGGQ